MARGEPQPATARLLSRLFEEHGRALELFARQFCNSPEDAVQHAFLKLAKLGEASDTVVAWLYRVVRNRAISLARSEARRRRRERRAADAAQPWFEPSYADKLDAQAAAEALKALPQDEREIIVAHIWGGLTFEQIGRVVGCGASTAHRRYKAGLSSLRERLGSPCTTRTTKGS
jgi:RNA polymerase sigma-70 factor (ECF subfamily)